jgi:hypothetical protein
MCLWLPRTAPARQAADETRAKYGNMPLELWHPDDYALVSPEEREVGYGRQYERFFVRFIRMRDSSTGELLCYHWAICRENGSMYFADLGNALKSEELDLFLLARLSKVPVANAFTWSPEWARWSTGMLLQPVRGCCIWAWNPAGWYKVKAILKRNVKVYNALGEKGTHNIGNADVSRFCVTQEQLLALREERGIERPL